MIGPQQQKLLDLFEASPEKMFTLKELQASGFRKRVIQSLRLLKLIDSVSKNKKVLGWKAKAKSKPLNPTYFEDMKKDFDSEMYKQELNRKRKCRRCNCILNSFNKDAYCSPCQKHKYSSADDTGVIYSQFSIPTRT